MNGKFEVKFSSDVRVPTVQELFMNLSGLSTISLNNGDPRILSQSQSSQEIVKRSNEINQNLSLIQKLLQKHGCLQMELLPGSEQNTDMKKFNWQLNEFQEDKISIELLFDSPENISMDGYDKLRITFNNTKAFLSPIDDKKLVIPDEFKIEVNIPPQEREILSQE